jgi:hypothetical protein
MHGQPAAYFISLVGMLHEQSRSLAHVRAARLAQENGTAARLDAIVPEVQLSQCELQCKLWWKIHSVSPLVQGMYVPRDRLSLPPSGRTTRIPRAALRHLRSRGEPPPRDLLDANRKRAGIHSAAR